MDFNLDSIFKDLILKLGDIEIAVKGDSTTSDDDTTNNFNIDMSPTFKTNLKDILGDINIDLTNKLRSLFDDINIDLTNKFRQLFDDIKIKVVVDNDINTDIDTPVESTVTDVTTEPIVSDIPSESTVIDVTTEPIVSDIPGESTVTDVPVEPVVSDVPSESTVTEVTTTYDIVEPTEPIEDDDFWIQVKNILVEKIPLYADCLDIIEPLTSVSSDDLLNSNTDMYLPIGDGDLIESNSLESYSSDDGQLNFDSVVYQNVLGLANVGSSATGNRIISIPLSGTFFGYEFKDFKIDISYYYQNYRTKLSDVILTICYLSFAWSIVHRISIIYGGSRSDNDKGGD